MNSAIERLLSLRVADIMNVDILTISESDSMTSAAKRLFDHDVTGAPVVDAFGKCVGILSASDFVGRDADQHPTAVLVRTSIDEPYQLESLNDNLVKTHMSSVVRTVDAHRTLIDAARAMCDDHIHRLVVVDEAHRPVGIISTLDILAAMVAAIEE